MSEEHIQLDIPLSHERPPTTETTYKSYESLLVNASLNSDLFVQIIGYNRPDQEGNSVAFILDDGLKSLKDWLKEEGHLFFTKENDLTKDLQEFLFRLLSAISFLNNRGIVINPLTAENVVVDRCGKLKLQNLDILTEGFQLVNINNKDKYGVLKVLGIEHSRDNARVEELCQFMKYFSTAQPKHLMYYVDNPSIWPKRNRIMYRSMSYDNLFILASKAADDLRSMSHPWVRNASARGILFGRTLKIGNYKGDGFDFLRFSKDVIYHVNRKLSCDFLEDELTALWPRFMPSCHKIFIKNKLYFSPWYYHDIK